MSYAALPTTYDPNTTQVVAKTPAPNTNVDGYQGMIAIPISPEEQAAANTQNPSWYNYFSDTATTFGNYTGLTTDPNKAASEGGIVSTPGVTGTVKDFISDATGTPVTKTPSEQAATSSAGWEVWATENVTRVIVAVLGLMVIFLALRKMM